VRNDRERRNRQGRAALHRRRQIGIQRQDATRPCARLASEFTGALRKEQATRESLTRRLITPAPQLLASSPSGRASGRDSPLLLIAKLPPDSASQTRVAEARLRLQRSGLLPRCSPAESSMPRRSIGSTRFCISSKSHPISPFRSLGEGASPPLRYPYRKADGQREQQKPEHHPYVTESRLFDAPHPSDV
jgi:hypothetical protein